MPRKTRRRRLESGSSSKEQRKAGLILARSSVMVSNQVKNPDAEPAPGAPEDFGTFVRRVTRTAGNYQASALSGATQAVKELPQPQLRAALGFWKTKPWRMSVSSYSSVVPFRYKKLLGSTNKREPCSSKTLSRSRAWVSRRMAYDSPEQPPPCTPTRRPPISVDTRSFS